MTDNDSNNNTIKKSDMVRLLHEHFDKNKDGFLNFQELKSLQRETSGDNLDENSYVMVCRALDCHPNNGLTLDALLLTYASNGDANIEEDYLAVFPTKEIQKQEEPKGGVEDVFEVGDDGVDIS
eukprot:CAMPEP_0195526152 /NCGR_PEP_ID=MMETSP0794_2-20130614/27051_1 /TAXON_ID=515487 /ORGANISM="Stephanopyxis turris, Strain CCMP 815" /LENGTH=123 /DNA_ID=CAMNT_0040656775 /DNA_START=37 /DNA_END=408 /DNA_ORIENTATION=+